MTSLSITTTLAYISINAFKFLCLKFIVWLIGVTIVITVFFVRKRVYYIFSSCPSSTSCWILMCLIVSFLLASSLNNSLLSFNCTPSIHIRRTCQWGQSHDDYSGMESNTSGHFRFLGLKRWLVLHEQGYYVYITWFLKYTNSCLKFVNYSQYVTWFKKKMLRCKIYNFNQQYCYNNISISHWKFIVIQLKLN